MGGAPIDEMSLLLLCLLLFVLVFLFLQFSFFFEFYFHKYDLSSFILKNILLARHYYYWD